MGVKFYQKPVYDLGGGKNWIFITLETHVEVQKIMALHQKPDFVGIIAAHSRFKLNKYIKFNLNFCFKQLFI